MKELEYKYFRQVNAIKDVLNVLVPFVYSIYVARVLPEYWIGKVTIAQNIAQYFVYIAALGIPNYGIREIAKNRDTRDGINKLFTELFIINAISTGLATLCYYFYINDEPHMANQHFQRFFLSHCIALLHLVYQDGDHLQQYTTLVGAPLEFSQKLSE